VHSMPFQVRNVLLHPGVQANSDGREVHSRISSRRQIQVQTQIAYASQDSPSDLAQRKTSLAIMSGFFRIFFCEFFQGTHLVTAGAFQTGYTCLGELRFGVAGTGGYVSLVNRHA